MTSPLRYWLTLLFLCVVIVVTAWLSLHIHLDSLADDLHETVQQLRSYRLALSALVGSSLAVAGVMMQGLFRNPLADPGIIGAGAGAAFGGMLSLWCWTLIAPFVGNYIAAEMIIPASCLIGAIVALVSVLAVLKKTHNTITVLLYGMVLTLFFGGLSSMVRLMVQDDWQLNRALMGFTLGNIGDKGMTHIWLSLPLCIGSLIAAWFWAPQLDLLQTGEEEAQSLGLDLVRTRRWLIIWSALPVAAAVAIAGNIGFVGLMVPHMLRRILGPRHRPLIPAAALGGAAFVLVCDLIGHSFGPGHVIPLGVVTGLVGAPLFVWLLIGSRRNGAWS